MSNIFNVEQIYAEIRQKQPLIGPSCVPIIFFMCMKQDTTNTSATTFNISDIGPNDLIQTSSSPLYESIGDDLNPINCIGKNSSNVTVYRYNVHNTDNLYDSFVQTVYRLPLGTVGIAHTPKLQQFDNFYALPNDKIEIAPITFGTGAFIDKKGFVAIITGYTILKMVAVFITGGNIIPV